MRHPAHTVLELAVMLLAVVTPGCSSGGGESTAKGTDQAAPATSSTTAAIPIAPAVTVTAREYGFDVPPEIEGGVIRLTLQNDGKFKHEGVILSVGDTPLSRVKQDLAPIVKGDGRPTPDYLHFRGGISLVPAGTSEMSILTLPAGNYVMVCTLTDADSLKDDAGPPSDDAQRFHFDLGMAAPFTVKKTNTGAMPPTDGTFVARDWAFDVPPLVPGFKVMTFRNDGEQDHSLAVAEFPDGVDEASAKEAFEILLKADDAHPAPDSTPVPDDVAFAGPLSRGGQSTFPINWKVHRTYVFACYMSDRTGGPLHAVGKHMVAYSTTPNG